jgi:hypothetical protein
MDTSLTLAEIVALGGTIVTLITAGIAYGRMNGKVDALQERVDRNEVAFEERMDKHEKNQQVRNDTVDRKLDGIRDTLTDLRVMLEGLSK